VQILEEKIDRGFVASSNGIKHQNMARSIEKLWDLLGNDLSLLFGKECAAAAMWMFWCLLFRLVLLIVRLERYVAFGIIFAFPFLIQVSGERGSAVFCVLRCAECLVPARCAALVPVVVVMLFEIVVTFLC
jgi:hypothetical protein